MSTPSTSSPTSPVAKTGNVALDALLSGVKWGGAAGSGIEITFSFPWTSSSSAVFAGLNGGAYSAINEQTAADHHGLNAVQQTAVRNALQAWASVANIVPRELSDNTQEVGDIRVAWTSANTSVGSESKAWGWAHYPDRNFPVGGDIWISTIASGATDNNWSAGSYNYLALMHELGHALGLKHPFEDNAVLDATHNTKQYTIMAYQEAEHSLFVDVSASGNQVSWTAYPVQPDSPMLYDIAVMQHLYGANMSYRTGDDVYTFDPSTPFLRTLWDAGGNDTISVNNFTVGSVIDLRQGTYSSIGIPSDNPGGYNWTVSPPKASYDGTQNLAIAYGAVIENAIGGSGNDVLIGNSSANRLQGNGGANQLDGGDGIDTAVYTSAFRNYAVTSVDGGYRVASLTVAGQVDTVINVERFEFSSGTVAVNMAALATDPLQSRYIELAQKFYVGYFGRPADANGLSNMVSQLQGANVPTSSTGALVSAYDTNATIKSLIDSFGNSAESAALYQGSNRAFVTDIYNHLLGRAPDAEGLDFWTNALDNPNGLSRGLAAMNIIAGAETNTTAQGQIDAALIATRITVAANFTDALKTPAQVAGYAGNAAAATARALLDGVTHQTNIFGYESNVLDTISQLALGRQAIGEAPVTLVGVASLSAESGWVA